MSGQIENLYKVQKKDIPKAGVVLADAFQHDPVWKKVLEEAKIVRKIFKWIARERVSIAEVCRRLKRHGIRTKTGNENWDRATVWGMLKNPTYKGMIQPLGSGRFSPWSDTYIMADVVVGMIVF